jgi:hypothetical protein
VEFYELAFATEFGWTFDQVLALPLSSFDNHVARFDRKAE